MAITFSISLPVYKQEEFITTALESLRCQTVPFELAVLDATPDNSIQTILQNYQSMITYQYHHADKGQSTAIQEGWNNTQGEIVAWLNADDYYFPDTLAKVAAIFQTHPEIDVVYGHTVYVDAKDTFEQYFPAISANLALLPKTNIICQPSCFVRRSAMERVGGVNPQLHYIMDWDLWIRLYKANCKFYFLDEMLSVARIYPDTKTLTGSTKRFKEIATLLKANASWRDRLIAWLGFYYDEYKYNKIKNKSFLSVVIYSLLSTLRYVRIQFKHATQVVIKGIACKTNLVKDQCEIVLPWYAKNPATSVYLTTDTDNKFYLNYAEKKIELTKHVSNEQVSTNKKTTSHQYYAPLPAIPQNSLAFTIASEQNNWCLLSLKVN
jgi:glycosyltransferase involved in cell wall biosynthesis